MSGQPLVRLLVVAVVLACATGALATRDGSAAPRRAAAAPPLPVSFSGRYSVTFRVTNAKGFAPTRWVYGVVSACAKPCRSVSFHQRLTTESSWRSYVLTYAWSGTGFALAPRTQRDFTACRAAGGASVAKGYDVVSTQVLRPVRSVNGRVVELTGSGRDDYVPNAKGRKAGCKAGTYTFAISGRG